jgi:hypothetical protein
VPPIVPHEPNWRWHVDPANSSGALTLKTNFFPRNKFVLSIDYLIVGICRTEIGGSDFPLGLDNLRYRHDSLGFHLESHLVS